MVWTTFFHSERLKKLNLFNFSKRRLRGDFIVVFKYLCQEKNCDSRSLFNLADKGITRSNSWKLKLEKLRLELLCKCLTVSFNNPPRDVLDFPSLKVLKSRLVS